MRLTYGSLYPAFVALVTMQLLIINKHTESNLLLCSAIYKRYNYNGCFFFFGTESCSIAYQVSYSQLARTVTTTDGRKLLTEAPTQYYTPPRLEMELWISQTIVLINQFTRCFGTPSPPPPPPSFSPPPLPPPSLPANMSL